MLLKELQILGSNTQSHLSIAHLLQRNPRVASSLCKHWEPDLETDGQGRARCSQRVPGPELIGIQAGKCLRCLPSAAHWESMIQVMTAQPRFPKG